MPRKKKVEEVVVETAPVEESQKPARRTRKKVAEVAEEVAKIEKKVHKKAAEKVEEAVKVIEEKKPVRRAKKKAPAIVIQSMMGGEIALDEILKKVEEKAAGKAVTNVYIKSEENKAFFVADGETDSVDLWD